MSVINYTEVLDLFSSFQTSLLAMERCSIKSLLPSNEFHSPPSQTPSSESRSPEEHRNSKEKYESRDSSHLTQCNYFPSTGDPRIGRG
jgi:hypothetical protein